MSDPTTSLLGGMFAFYGFTMLLFLVLGIVTFVFWINMLIKAIKNEYEHKTLWILAIIFGQAVGAILFYFIVYKEKIKPQVAKVVSQ
ncbi:MAG TPA: hypothetical protein VI981_03140 [Candidatus Paceibacterota bacterium]